MGAFHPAWYISKQCRQSFASYVYAQIKKLGVMDKFHAFFETLRSNGQISCSPLYFLLK